MEIKIKTHLILLLLITTLISGCMLIGSNPNKPAYILIEPAFVLLHPDETVRLDATLFNAEGNPLYSAITVSSAGGGNFNPQDGTFTATELGNHQLQFKSGSVVETVPVTVLTNDYAEYVQFIHDFTKALEGDDVDQVAKFLSPNAIFVDGVSGENEEYEGTHFLNELVPLILRWSLSDIEIDSLNHIISADSEVYIIDQEWELTIKSLFAITFELQLTDQSFLIDKITFQPMPSDESNPPNVKANVKISKKDHIKVGDVFKVVLRVNNTGGAGYYIDKSRLVLEKPGSEEDGGGSFSLGNISWIGPKSDPGWSNESHKPIYSHYVGYNLVYEVIVWSGTTPFNLTITDHQKYVYEIRE